jgi:hypothetical protein
MLMYSLFFSTSSEGIGFLRTPNAWEGELDMLNIIIIIIPTLLDIN